MLFSFSSLWLLPFDLFSGVGQTATFGGSEQSGTPGSVQQENHQECSQRNNLPFVRNQGGKF